MDNLCGSSVLYLQIYAFFGEKNKSLIQDHDGSIVGMC